MLVGAPRKTSNRPRLRLSVASACVIVVKVVSSTLHLYFREKSCRQRWLT